MSTARRPVADIAQVTRLRDDLDSRSRRLRYEPRPVKATPIALFESTEGWTGGSANTNPAYIGLGKQSYMRASTNAANSDSLYTPSAAIAWDYANYPLMELLVYIDDAAKLDLSNGIILYCATDASLTRYAVSALANMLATNPPIVSGWNVLRVAKSQFTAQNGWTDADWGNLGHLRIRVKSVAGQTVTAYYSAWRAIKPRGLVILNHDDGPSTVSQMWAIEEKYGLRSSNFICSGIVGTAANKTWDELWAAYLKGHDICNHTATHQRLSTLDAAGKTAEVQTCYNALIGRGFSRSARFFAAPYNESSADITAAVSPFHQMCRSGGDATGAGVVYPVKNEYAAGYPSVDVNNSAFPDIDVVKGYVTGVAASGRLLNLLTHNIGDTATTSYISATAYDELCAHIAASDVDCITWSEYFDTAAPHIGGLRSLPTMEQRIYINAAGTLAIERTV